MKNFTLDKSIFFALSLFAFSVISSVTAVETALLLALTLLLAKKYQEKTLSDIGTKLTGHPLFVPWLVYLGICLLTTLTAYYPAKGFGQLNSDFLKYVCLSTLLLTVKKEHLPKLSAIYTLAALISAFIGIYLAARAMAAGIVDLSRATAFMNPVRYGEVMAIALTLILSRIVIPVKETFRHEQLFYKLAVFPVFIALVLSQTRGAYLGVVVAMAFMFYFASFSRKKVALYIVILGITAGLATLVNPTIRQRVTTIVDRNPTEMTANTPSTAINIRLELWKLGITMFKAHPVLGVGPDNVKKVFKQFHPGPVGYQEVWGSLHSLYIHQAAERGILGLGALLLLFGAMLWAAFKNFEARGNPYTLWALCALPAYYMMNLTEISFQHVHTSFAVFLALAVSYNSAE